MTQVIVLAKQPVPGRTKTRLTPPFTPVEAAALAGAALEDTLRTVAATPVSRRVLALDGDGRIPSGFAVLPQRGEGLDQRLAAAFEDAGTVRPTVLIGMDTPQLTPALLLSAVEALATHDAVFGPATDGGFWLIGFRRPEPAVFLGVPMSTPETGRIQLARLLDAGLRVRRMPLLTDVDTAADAWQVAAEAPGSRFAALLAQLARS